ncbi:MAG: TraR/DksA family transcriptional regulator [Candidatus Aminicenantaceae bacterium]
MNKDEKEKFREKLLKRKEDIISVMSEAYSDSRKIETEVAQDAGDKAESSYTKEFLFSLSDTEREQLLLIDEALKRLERGDYGICQTCGKNISKKRLNAVPWARYCITCQEKEERGNP